MYINDKCIHVYIPITLLVVLCAIVSYICVVLYVYIYIADTIPIGSKFDRQSDYEPLNFGGQLIFDAVNYHFATGHWKIGKVQ